MKIWKYILSAAALLALGACNHDADEMVIPTRNLDIANHSNLIVSDLTAAEEFSLTWSAAKFGVETEVEYAVSAAVNGGEAVTLATTSDLYYSTTNAELLAALAISMGGEYAVDFTVTATAAVEGLESVSDTISLTITLDKEAILYVVGGYQGWNPAGACSRLLAGEDGIFRGFVNILADTEGKNEVKFTTQQNWSGTNYGMAEGAISTAPDAGNIVLAVGLHYIHFDLANLKLVDVPLTSIGLIGEAVGGWDADAAKFTFDAEKGVWTAVVENVVAEKEYKVRFNDMWDVVDAENNAYNISLGGEANNLVMGGGNLKAGYNGKVTFTLNLFDAPYTLAEAGPAPTLLHIIGGYQGWNHGNAHSTIKGEGGVLTGYFYVPNAESKEFKFCTDLNWDGINYGMTADGVISTDGGAGNITLEPGLWHIKFDYYANTLTTTAITKVGLIGNGDAFGGWGTDVEMTYNETTQTWNATIENVPADNEYKVRFNADWGINLGGDATDLTQDGANLKTVKSGTVTYELNIFAHPYTIVEK